MRNGLTWQLVLYGEACCASAFAILATQATAQSSQRVTVSGFVSPRCWAVPSFAPTDATPSAERQPIKCSNSSAAVRVEQTEPADPKGNARQRTRVTVSPKT